MRLTHWVIQKRNLYFTKKQFSQLIDSWNINYTSRRDLRELDVSRLEDVGLTPFAAEQEGKKPFWRK